MKRDWMKYVLMILLFEKIIQHIVVSLAFYFDWENIRSTVVVDPGLLMVLGILAVLLFSVSLWGVNAQQKWALNLIIALALFDMIGEFAAQGKIMIVITVSFVVASILLVLVLSYRRQQHVTA